MALLTFMAGQVAQTSNLGSFRGRAWWAWGAPLTLLLAVFIAYHNTFSAPFIFDDIPAMADHSTLGDVRRPSDSLAPPALRGSGVAGRPVVALSLAFNRAVGGDDVRGYHAFNLAVHAAAGLLLFGVVRRTARRYGRVHAPEVEARADGLGFFVALLWLVHPLQTESVTCIIQRTESLAGLFFLATFYGFVRSVESPGAVR